MVLSFQLLLLAFSVLSAATPTSAFQPEKRARSNWQHPLDDVTWIEPERSFVVKLDTPGYPLWIMDKTNAPPKYKDAADYYHPLNESSAVLLNFTLSSDNKTLYLNHRAILPLADTMAPPHISAYQVPANISKGAFGDIRDWRLLDGRFFGMTISFRYLDIDYDRLVWADPAKGPYMNHVPVLRLRIMGLGAQGQDDVLDVLHQKVVHVTLADQRHGSSDASDRSYLITNVELKEGRRSYAYAGVLPNEVSRVDDCPTRSWLCEDHDLYSEGTPWYRYIWRSKFDRFGRIGSKRHEVMKIWYKMSDFIGSTWPIWVITTLSTAGAVALGYVVYRMIRYMRWLRLQRIQSLAEEDGLLGAPKDGEAEEGFGAFGHDDDPPRYEDAVKPLPSLPPPLPPRYSSTTPAEPTDDENLIALNNTRSSTEREA